MSLFDIGIARSVLIGSVSIWTKVKGKTFCNRSRGDVLIISMSHTPMASELLAILVKIGVVTYGLQKGYTR
jgi:hypothetical protein